MEEQSPGKGSIDLISYNSQVDSKVFESTVLKWKDSIRAALHDTAESGDRTQAVLIHAGNTLYDILYYGNSALEKSNKRVGSIRLSGITEGDVVVPVNEQLLRSLFLAEPDIQSKDDDRELQPYREDLLDPSKDAVEIVL